MVPLEEAQVGNVVLDDEPAHDGAPEVKKERFSMQVPAPVPAGAAAACRSSGRLPLPLTLSQSMKTSMSKIFDIDETVILKCRTSIPVYDFELLY